MSYRMIGFRSSKSRYILKDVRPFLPRRIQQVVRVRQVLAVQSRSLARLGLVGSLLPRHRRLRGGRAVPVIVPDDSTLRSPSTTPPGGTAPARGSSSPPCPESA